MEEYSILCSLKSYHVDYANAHVIWNLYKVSLVLPDPYRQDLAFRLLNAVCRRPKYRTKENMPFPNLHED